MGKHGPAKFTAKSDDIQNAEIRSLDLNRRPLGHQSTWIRTTLRPGWRF
jgi:hypothetical protein